MAFARSWGLLMRLQNFLAGLFLAGAVSTAAATGELECSIKDESVRFSIHAGLTRGMGSPTFDLKGELKFLGGTVADNYRVIHFGNLDRPQYWLDSKELRLLLYWEREGTTPFASVALEIRTEPLGGSDDTGPYEGRYKLSGYNLLGDSLKGADGPNGKLTTLEGSVTCSVE